MKFIVFALGLAAVIPMVALAQSYPPYPYNLLYRGGAPYDRGYSDGYKGVTSPADTDPAGSEYGRGAQSGNTDYWIDLMRRSEEEARRRNSEDTYAAPE